GPEQCLPLTLPTLWVGSLPLRPGEKGKLSLPPLPLRERVGVRGGGPQHRSGLDRAARRGTLRRRQHVEARPEPRLERIGIAGGQARGAHLPGGALVVVGESMVLDAKAVGRGHEQAEPNPRRAVVGGHADGAGIVPELAGDQLGEGNAGMAGDDAIRREARDLPALHRLRRRGEEETVDLPYAAVDHRNTPTAEL